MILNTDAVLRYLNDQTVTWCQIWSPEGVLFCTYASTPEHPIEHKRIVELVQLFADQYGGKWRLHAKKTPSSQDSTKARIDVDFGQPKYPDSRYNQPMQGINYNPMPAQPVVDVDKITEKITERIRKELEQENKIDKLSKQLEELKNGGANNTKLDKVMDVFLSRMGNKGQKQVQLAGTPGTEKTFTPEETTKYKEGLAIFMQSMDATTFANLAEKVKADPSLIGTVKSLLNI